MPRGTSRSSSSLISFCEHSDTSVRSDDATRDRSRGRKKERERERARAFRVDTFKSKKRLIKGRLRNITRHRRSRAARDRTDDEVIAQRITMKILLRVQSRSTINIAKRVSREREKVRFRKVTSTSSSLKALVDISCRKVKPHRSVSPPLENGCGGRDERERTKLSASRREAPSRPQPRPPSPAPVCLSLSLSLRFLHPFDSLVHPPGLRNTCEWIARVGSKATAVGLRVEGRGDGWLKRWSGPAQE